MRKIKFRVYDHDAKCYCKDVGHLTIDVDGIIINYQNGEGNNIYELEQFTGIHDCEGKEIYEGDIVENITDVVVWKFNGEVVFGNANASFMVKDFNKPGFCTLSNKNQKIIGNIHEVKQ